MWNFQTEWEWQIQFYNNLRTFDGTIPTLEDNTDGVVRGTLLEFKLSIPNINIVLFQAIKYLSRMRNLGKKIPSQILLISLNNEKAYLFQSTDFLQEIETQYIWGASKNNQNFSTNIKPQNIDYKNNLIAIVEVLRNQDFIKVHVDKYNIVWLSKVYYETVNDGSIEMKLEKKYHKIEFVEELIQPKFLHTFPYASDRDEVYEKSKKEFPWLIDCLNDKFLQKELWAFYTPDPYVKKQWSFWEWRSLKYQSEMIILFLIDVREVVSLKISLLMRSSVTVFFQPMKRGNGMFCITNILIKSVWLFHLRQVQKIV